MDDTARTRSDWRRWGIAGGGDWLLIPIVAFALLMLTQCDRRVCVADLGRAEADIATISAAVEVFAIEHGGRTPASLLELEMPNANGRIYLMDRRTLPLDPWHNPYCYEPPTATRAFRVFSLGSDGAPGGFGDAADIDSDTALERIPEFSPAGD